MKKLSLDLFEKPMFKDAVQLNAIVGGCSGNSYSVVGAGSAGGHTLEDGQYDKQTVYNVIADSVD